MVTDTAKPRVKADASSAVVPEKNGTGPLRSTFPSRFFEPPNWPKSNTPNTGGPPVVDTTLVATIVSIPFVFSIQTSELLAGRVSAHCVPEPVANHNRSPRDGSNRASEATR